MAQLLWRRLCPAVLILAGIFSIGAFPPFLSAEGFDTAFSRPVVLGDRSVAYIFRSDDGIWRFSTRDAFTGKGLTDAPLRLDAVFEGLRLHLDRENKLWLAGEEHRPGEGLLRVGRLDDLGFAESRLIGIPAGWNDGADLAFPISSDPWVAWRFKSGQEEDILVEDLSTGLRWRLAYPGDSALSPPLIRTDRKGGLWVLWTGIRKGRYLVAGRHFDGRGWSEEVRVADNGDRPCLGLDAGNGRDGFLRIAWSAYDGRFYKIQVCEWAGFGWSKPRTLSNRSEMEANPRLVGWGGNNEAVVWSGLNAGNKRILALALDGPRGNAPVVVSDSVETPEFEAIGTDQGLFLIRDGRPGLRFDAFRKDILDKRRSMPETGAEHSDSAGDSPSGLLISTRLESEYIGFGDSITFGYINRQEAPDRGYIPRLDRKLDTVFGPTTVVNSGYPGEHTIEGLARIDSVLAAQQGRYLLLMEGTNDVKNISTSIPTSLYNLKEICRRCLAANVMPLLATVIPRRDDIWEYAYYQERHYALEAGIRALAPQLAIPLVEMEQAFNDYPGGPDNLLSDYVHPNDAGYVVMTDVWYAAVRALPFPPVGISFLTKSKSSGSFSDTGYLLTWEANPKNLNIDSIKGFRIYRKKAAESASSFVRIGEVEGVFAFLDRSVDGTTVYDYVITTVTKDNVEGAGSATARR
ncbi:MAG: SGNH/GDSL hydrolase family protein [Candidatus Aminicenantes bacterium]|nr:SGNH/GDSL hydrolase family protein [Candidatus Aminicenantes bacterium]